MHLQKLLATSILLSFIAYPSWAAIVPVTNNADSGAGSLRQAIMSASPNDTIDLSAITGQTITLASSMQAINKNLIFNGSNVTINGGNTFQVFSVASGTIAIDGFNIQNAVSKGGNGADGGGGGAGGGGGLYVHNGANVTISNIHFINNQATGGNGGDILTALAGGGGGGFGGGNGGLARLDGIGGGGGGNTGGGDGGNGNQGNVIPGTPGGNGVNLGGGGGGSTISLPVFTGTNGGNSVSFSGGSGSAITRNGGGGAGAGGNGNSGNTTSIGGIGIGVDNFFGGGGGGAVLSNSNAPNGFGTGGGGASGNLNIPGGNGGVAGGGGGWGFLVGGNGGFGGGGSGTSNLGITGSSLFGGGGGATGAFNKAGGGGAGMGGAIFLQNGAILTVGDGVTFSGDSATGGLGGQNLGGIFAPNGGAYGQDLFFRTSSNVTFNINGDVNVPNAIESDQGIGGFVPGTFIKTGTGTLTLNGNNTYITSTGTQVQQGTLVINGSVADSVIVQTQGILSGNATMFNLTNSGIVSPGTPTNVFNVNNFTQLAGSTTQIHLDPSGSSRIIAAGVASLTGNLNLVAVSTLPVRSYNIIHANGGVVGQFTSVNDNLPGINFFVQYLPNDVNVTVISLFNGLTGNAARAANCFFNNDFIPGTDPFVVLEALSFLDLEGQQEAFNRIQPSQVGAFALVQQENAIMMRSAYTRHLNEARLSCDCIDFCEPLCNRMNFWSEVLGGWQNQHNRGQNFGFKNVTGGTAAGLEAYIRPDVIAGLMGGYSYSKLDWSKGAGKGHINSYYGGFYGSYSKDIYFMDAGLIGGYNKYGATRHIKFSSIRRNARSDHSGYEILANMGTGLNLNLCQCNVQPFIRFDYVYLNQKRSSEYDANSLNMVVAGKNNHFFRGETGVYVSKCLNFDCAKFMVDTKLAYVYETQLNNNNYRAGFRNLTCRFNVKGLNPTRNLFAPGISLTYLTHCDQISFSARYNAEIERHYQLQEASFHFDAKF